MRFDDAAREIPGALSVLLEVSPSEVQQMPVDHATSFGGWIPDLLINIQGLEFAIEYKSSSRAEQIGSAVQALQSADIPGHLLPLIVVPHMGDVGRRICRDAGFHWMDLSGNARIHRDGLHITVEGKENRFKARGRPPNLFAPKSARIVRLLLIERGERFRQQELADRADVHRSHVSRLVGRLVEAGFAEKAEDGSVGLLNPDLLLDAWSEAYDIRDHRIRKGHIAARAAEEALGRLVGALDEAGCTYAATGLPAAWLYTRYAGYRLLTVYVGGWLDAALLDRIGWNESERGANIWLLEPNDVGVFYGSQEVEGVRCVHPLQSYLDLRGLPERAAEAADVLRERMLPGGRGESR